MKMLNRRIDIDFYVFFECSHFDDCTAGLNRTTSDLFSFILNVFLSPIENGLHSSQFEVSKVENDVTR